jgi:hypothetical protein
MREKQRHGRPYVSEELRDGAVSRLLALRERGDFRSDQVAPLPYHRSRGSNSRSR